jgi:hypothetical protein
VNQKQQRGPTNPVIFYPEGYTDDVNIHIYFSFYISHIKFIPCILNINIGTI